MANLRQRTHPPSSGNTEGSFQQKNRSHGSHDPSRKRKKKSPSWQPAAVLISISGLVTFVILNTFLLSDGDHRSLRSAFSLRPSNSLKGPVDYSKVPLCIANYEDMPELWRPPMAPDGKGGWRQLFIDPETGEPQSKDPWTNIETVIANQTLYRALDEMVTYYHTAMTGQEILNFQPDGINSLIDMAYSTTGEFHERALRAARDMFVFSAITLQSNRANDDDQKEAGTDENGNDGNGDDGTNGESNGQEDKEMKRGDDVVTQNHRRLEEKSNDDDGGEGPVVPQGMWRRGGEGCIDQHFKMKMADYGHWLVENIGLETVKEEDPELQTAYETTVESVRNMIETCGTLDRILDLNITSDLFEDPDQSSDDVFGYLIKAIALVELKTVPEIELPMPSTDLFVANLWKYLATYNLRYARDSPQHYWDNGALDHAWLATHIAYLPSGYGRHRQQVEDAPFLYQYIRENYYYAMEQGRIDLVSEFVDLIRTYGCTEENDYQLRDGTRFVMKKFYEELHGKWIDYETPDNHYNRIHNPWAGSAAVMLGGESEPVVPGSYGYAFYSILKNQERTELL